MFAPLPVDEQPDVAQIRAYELGRALSGVMAERKPPEWTLALQQAYEAARIAAGIQTVGDQQRAAQAQQEQVVAQQQAAAQEQQGQQDFTAQVGEALQQFSQQVQQVAKVTQQTAAQVEKAQATLDKLGTQTASTVAGIHRELDTVKQMTLSKGNGAPPLTLEVGESVSGAVTPAVAQAVAQVIAPIGDALAQMGAATQQLGQTVDAVRRELGNRPKQFRVVKDKAGRVVGAEAVEPESE